METRIWCGRGALRKLSWCPAAVVRHDSGGDTGGGAQDPELGELLDRVEEMYLGIKRQQDGMGGMLGALLSSMS